MPIYFIADLHLSESHPQLTALFQKFMQEKAVHAQAVYILGDLFDFWIGDDENSPLVQTIKQTIRSLTERGVACYFIHGNRDFLIGKTFARDTGMTLLPEYAVSTCSAHPPYSVTATHSAPTTILIKNSAVPSIKNGCNACSCSYLSHSD